MPESRGAPPAGDSGVIVSGSPLKIHTPSCKLADPASKSRHKNAAMAEKRYPAASVCETCRPDSEEQRAALNDSGFFLHSAVLKRVKRSGWSVNSEVSVSAAPFLYDPVKEPGVLKMTDAGRVLNRRKFLHAIADSQNKSQMRETAIDVVAVSGTQVLCVEVKKLNPRYVSWIFANHDAGYKEFAVLSKDFSDKSERDLLCVPRTGGSERDLCIRMESASLESALYTYDQGRALTKDAKGEYGFGNNSLADATRQIVEGTFGLVVESLMRDVSSGRFRAQSFLPTVVTTANILTCEYDANDLSSDGASGSTLEPKDLVIYNCPVPAVAKFPNQFADLKHHNQMRLSTKWPVLVLSPKGLDMLLATLENLARMARTEL